MPHLGAKQTLKIYSLVLFWSAFVFWVGFTVGAREPTLGEAGDRPLQASPRPESYSYQGETSTPLTNAEPGFNLVPRKTSGNSGKGREEELSIIAEDQPFFTVQIGAVRTKAEGRQLLMNLEEKGHHGRLIPPSGSGQFYRVWVGEWEGESQAKQIEKVLKRDGFSTYLQKRDHRQLP